MKSAFMPNKMNCFVIFILPVFFFTAYDCLEDYSNHTAWQYLPDHCGRSRFDGKSTRIIKGDRAKLGEFPWMARLGRYLSNRGLLFFCGGVLINRFYVLSAAHCEERVHLVRLGEHDAEKSRDCEKGRVCAPPHQDMKVKQIFFDNYCRSTIHDIMILELAKPAVFNDFVQPACIPRQSMTHEDLVGKDLILAGWGATNEDYSGSSRYLLSIVLKVQDKKTCKKRHPTFDKQGQFCLKATEKGQNVCKGDSGGPAIMLMEVDGQKRAYAFGVASYVLPNCRGGAVYTSITHYMKIILGAIKKS